MNKKDQKYHFSSHLHKTIQVIYITTTVSNTMFGVSRCSRICRTLLFEHCMYENIKGHPMLVYCTWRSKSSSIVLLLGRNLFSFTDSKVDGSRYGADMVCTAITRIRQRRNLH